VDQACLESLNLVLDSKKTMAFVDGLAESARAVQHFWNPWRKVTMPTQPEELSARVTLHSRILRALSQMPEQLREIFILSHYRSRSITEISDVLRLPASVVLSDLKKANRFLEAQIMQWKWERKSLVPRDFTALPHETGESPSLCCST
jgi:DNA-directed RNA polymerase specialized sigma24 family protein